ncbi:hypothetical protein KK137_04760 [Croceibacterium sp. LX-88]|uniref:Uncharacterized protein n=1 Tax=Croceibacterium selenioxidans TaxID=2838833 RepID=A0ABS5W1J4_9SPHN|nr:hypothetical protein [Croceibacterium selenioxidans]MBT2133638.1 hypothetical protein [Croceibacterium selenioxidans]
MIPRFDRIHAETEPGVASAENGLVVLDGPDGVAITMTAIAAAGTGHSLIAAAEAAERQIADKDDD